jgi:hypothetical protein
MSFLFSLFKINLTYTERVVSKHKIELVVHDDGSLFLLYVRAENKFFFILQIWNFFEVPK